MKNIILILVIILGLSGAVMADEYLIIGGSAGSYEYLVWDDTPGSQDYALISGTEGALTLSGAAAAGKSIGQIIMMLLILGGE